MNNYEIKNYRKLRDAFEKLLDYWKDNYPSIKTDGICAALMYMSAGGLINDSEYDEMEAHIKSKNPSRKIEPKFTIFASHYTFQGFGYWWTPNEEGYEQRTKFIEAIIEDIKLKLKNA